MGFADYFFREFVGKCERPQSSTRTSRMKKEITCKSLYFILILPPLLYETTTTLVAAASKDLFCMSGSNFTDKITCCIFLYVPYSSQLVNISVLLCASTSIRDHRGRSKSRAQFPEKQMHCIWSTGPTRSCDTRIENNHALFYQFFEALHVSFFCLKFHCLLHSILMPCQARPLHSLHSWLCWESVPSSG